MLSEISNEIKNTLESLRSNHFDTHFVPTSVDAKKLILEMIPTSATVGIGDSTTLRQIGILEALIQRGTEVINPFTKEITQDMEGDEEKSKIFFQTLRKTLRVDVFLTSSNAITEDGKIVSVDRAGNRVAGMIFGAPKVILSVGRNKLVRDLDSAIYRIKNVIAPEHAKRKGRNTPCTITNECKECNSPDRICNITVIVEKKPLHTDLSVILIDEDLGLGWDPAWDLKRINEIKSNYYKNSWIFFPPK